MWGVIRHEELDNDKQHQRDKELRRREGETKTDREDSFARSGAAANCTALLGAVPLRFDGETCRPPDSQYEPKENVLAINRVGCLT